MDVMRTWLAVEVQVVRMQGEGNMQLHDMAQPGETVANKLSLDNLTLAPTKQPTSAPLEKLGHTQIRLPLHIACSLVLGPSSRCSIIRSYNMAFTATATGDISDAPSNTGFWQPKTTSTYDKDDIITLAVGPEKREMMAYRSYISKSDFFQAALKKEWTEGQTRTIKLPEEKPAVVAQYLDFIFDRGLPTRPTKVNCRDGAVYDVLDELYGLGERFLDSPLRNAIIDEKVRFTTAGAQPR